MRTGIENTGVIIMSEAWIGLIASIGTGFLSLIGVYMANRKQTALIAYRIEQLEKKQDKHNNLIERMTKVEGRVDVIEREVNSK